MNYLQMLIPIGLIVVVFLFGFYLAARKRKIKQKTIEARKRTNMMSSYDPWGGNLQDDKHFIRSNRKISHEA